MNPMANSSWLSIYLIHYKVAFDKADNVQYSRCRINSEDSAGGITGTFDKSYGLKQ